MAKLLEGRRNFRNSLDPAQFGNGMEGVLPQYSSVLGDVAIFHFLKLYLTIVIRGFLQS